MAKELNKWLDEFVENGADPKNVTDWPEDAGGGGDGILIKTIKAGQKIRVDLSYYTNSIYQSDDDFHNSPMSLFATCSVNTEQIPISVLPSIIPDNYYFFWEKSYLISMIINEARTQILCEMGYPDENNNYHSIMPATVVYESATPIAYEDYQLPTEVMEQLPTIEAVVTSDLVGKVLYIDNDYNSIPFEIVD